MTRKYRKVVSVTSGKGGVGKTLTTVNLAVAARRMGHSVLILDGDLGLANVDVVLGIRTYRTIGDVLDGTCRINDVIVEGPLGIKIIPSGSGISSLAQLTTGQKQLLMQELHSIEEQFDVTIIDTGAGINQNVIHLNLAAQTQLVVTTPEPHAMTDAYALIKVLSEEYGLRQVNLIVNQAKSVEEGLSVAGRIQEVSRKFLQMDINYLGSIPTDPQVQKSVMLRKAASEHSTFTVAGQAWNNIARAMFRDPESDTNTYDKQEFWRNLLWSERPTLDTTI